MLSLGLDGVKMWVALLVRVPFESRSPKKTAPLKGTPM